MPDVTYPGVYVEEMPSGVHPIAGVPTSVTAFVGSAASGPVDQPTRVASFSEFGRTFGGASDNEPLGAAVRLYFLNGGTDAIVVRASGPAVPSADDGNGIYALDPGERFNLLCLPDLGAAASSAGVDAIALALAAASRLCEERRAILIVDPLPGWHNLADVVSDTAGVGAVASGMRRANAALYFPRVVAAGSAAQTTTELPPSGAIAGIIARTDAQRGVWKAPSGQEAAIAGIGGLAATLSGNEVRTLTELGVNPLRALPGTGPVVWGARTLAGGQGAASDWKYLPVRRLALFIEETLDRGLAWVVFEPNDEPLWAAIRATADAFMASLYHQGAFQGTTPRDAYFVKCGRDTTTQAELDVGLVNVVVAFAPLRPAEFVIIEIALMTGDHT